jgi:hypothetical protein
MFKTIVSYERGGLRMIFDTLLEIYMNEGRDEPEAMEKIAEDAIRGKRIREKHKQEKEDS